MSFNYQTIETNIPSSELSEVPPLYNFTDNSYNTQPVFALPNPLLHQYRIISNTQPYFDHQFSHLWQHRGARRPDRHPSPSPGATFLGLSRPLTNNYCFNLGLTNESNNNNHEESSYSTAETNEPFNWNNYTAMDDIIPNVDYIDVNDESKHLVGPYGELEAMYGLSNANNDNLNLGETSHNQAGSISALTVENSPLEANPPNDDPTPFRELHKSKRKRKRERKDLYKSMAGFFEGLVENVMSHQDRLHGKFIEAIERLERARSEREEAWRRQEAQAQSREAILRVHDRAMAATREALIVSCLEKITGHSVVESTRIDKYRSRWLGREVEDLMRIRTGLDRTCLKSPNWGEISDRMASMGYERSAQSCKEKWDFVDNYLSCDTYNKACFYYDDPSTSSSNSSTSNLCCKNLVDGFGVQRQSYVDLLKAFTSSTQPTSVGKLLFDVCELGSRKLCFEKEEFEEDHEEI